jgi:hypothetical protein
MRLPVVKRQTIPMSGFFLFPAYRIWRAPPSVACADLSSMGRCQPSAAAPHTYGGSVATWVASAENHWGSPLRPRTEAVPSCRPRQRGGYAGAACPLGSGSGGAAHVCGLRRSPLLQEPARVSKQSLGRWENKPPRTLAFIDAVQQDRARSSQADPCVSSEAAGSPALLP